VKESATAFAALDENAGAAAAAAASARHMVVRVLVLLGCSCSLRPCACLRPLVVQARSHILPSPITDHPSPATDQKNLVKLQAGLVIAARDCTSRDARRVPTTCSSKAHLPSPRLCRTWTVEMRSPPAAVYQLNYATKWLVTLAQTVAVWYRRDFVSPFIVLGSIFATFGTESLKRAINQQRPDGAPFSDPGMPSSHALVSSFAATAWACHCRSPVATAVLLSASALVSVLRVVCGYHTWAQVLVGSLIGVSAACGWMSLGSAINTWATRPALVAAVVWVLYLCGAAVFISRKMPKWLDQEAAL